MLKKKKWIHYYYEDHKTNERIEVKESIIDFMKKIIQHIPETQFKMIRYYGLYATCEHTHKKVMDEKRGKSKSFKKHIIIYRIYI